MDEQQEKNQAEHEFRLEQWKIASELQKNEDTLTWQRFNYYVTLMTILATGVAYILASSEFEATERYSFLALLSLIGIIVALAFASIFVRAYRYQRLRRLQAAAAEKRLYELIGVKEPQEQQEETGPEADYDKWLPIYREDIVEKVSTNLLVSFLGDVSTHSVIIGLSILSVVGWLVALVYALANLIK